MHDQSFSSNPFEAWASASAAVAAASLEIAASASSAAMSWCTAAMLPMTGAGARLAADEYTLRRPSREPQGREPDVGGAPGSRGSTGRASWYRAPYRSPFDPLFWMTPGHPVDHAGDWLSPLLAAIAPQLGAQVSPGRVACDGSAWLAGPWSLWLEMMSPASRSASWAMMAPPANIVDFGAAYSAYRTAGGHAVAQIMHASMPALATPRETATAVTAAFEMAPWLWLLPFAPPGWLPTRED